MTTFEIKNTIVENNTNVIVFVNFYQDGNTYAETFRFPLNTSVQVILEAIQSKAAFFDQRKIVIEDNRKTLEEELMNNILWQS